MSNIQVKGLCPPARTNVLFSAAGDCTPERFSFLRHIVCPLDEMSLNWTTVTAEIAEIMQIGP